MAAEGIFGRAFQTLRNYAVVARSFETSRRRDNLAFSHYAELTEIARTEPEKADETSRRREVVPFTAYREVARSFETSRRREVVPFSHYVELTGGSRAFETSRRREVVPFTHHREAASLPAARPRLPLDLALDIIPSLPRPLLARLAARIIERLDEIDGDPDLEPNGDEFDHSGGEDDCDPTLDRLRNLGPGCPVAEGGI